MKKILAWAWLMFVAGFLLWGYALKLDHQAQKDIAVFFAALAVLIFTAVSAVYLMKGAR